MHGSRPIDASHVDIGVIQGVNAQSGANGDTWIGAEAGDLDLYQRTAGNLRRLLEGIGLDRIARDVTPSLQEYIDSKAVEA
jgi:hypothetical protein